MITFIPKQNIVHDVYAKVGVPFPAGLPSGEEEHFIEMAPADLCEAYLAVSDNPFIDYAINTLVFVLYSDIQPESMTTTITVEGNSATDDAPLCNLIEGTGTEYDGKYITQTEAPTEGLVPTDPGTYGYELVFSADGQIYTFTGTFTVPEAEQEIEQ